MQGILAIVFRVRTLLQILLICPQCSFFRSNDVSRSGLPKFATAIALFSFSVHLFIDQRHGY